MSSYQVQLVLISDVLHPQKILAPVIYDKIHGGIPTYADMLVWSSLLSLCKLLLGDFVSFINLLELIKQFPLPLRVHFRKYWAQAFISAGFKSSKVLSGVLLTFFVRAFIYFPCDLLTPVKYSTLWCSLTNYSGRSWNRSSYHHGVQLFPSSDSFHCFAA